MENGHHYDNAHRQGRGSSGQSSTPKAFAPGTTVTAVLQTWLRLQQQNSAGRDVRTAKGKYQRMKRADLGSLLAWASSESKEGPRMRRGGICFQTLCAHWCAVNGAPWRDLGSWPAVWHVLSIVKKLTVGVENLSAFLAGQDEKKAGIGCPRGIVYTLQSQATGQPAESCLPRLAVALRGFRQTHFRLNPIPLSSAGVPGGGKGQKSLLLSVAHEGDEPCWVRPGPPVHLVGRGL